MCGLGLRCGRVARWEAKSWALPWGSPRRVRVDVHVHLTSHQSSAGRRQGIGASALPWAGFPSAGEWKGQKDRYL